MNIGKYLTELRELIDADAVAFFRTKREYLCAVISDSAVKPSDTARAIEIERLICEAAEVFRKILDGIQNSWSPLADGEEDDEVHDEPPPDPRFFIEVPCGNCGRPVYALNKYSISYPRIEPWAEEAQMKMRGYVCRCCLRQVLKIQSRNEGEARSLDHYRELTDARDHEYFAFWKRAAAAGFLISALKSRSQ